jgi:glycosyltransferase involved in cell wall biosynthesis
MRILILTQYYPPETGAPQNRLSDLARRLKEFGHTVTILTALPNYPRGEIFEAYRGHIIVEENLGGITVIRTWIYATQSKSFVPRLLNYFSFVISSVALGWWRIGSQEVVVVESPPLFLGISGFLLSVFKNARLVLNISDLWPDSAVSMGILKNKLLVGLSRRLEEFLYRHSCLITGQTRGIVENIRSRMRNKKVALITNGVDVDAFAVASQVNQRDSIRREFGLGVKHVIGYAGLHGLAQGLETVVQAARLLAHCENLLFVFFGDGPEKKKLMELAQQLGLDNVSFFPPEDTKRMPAIIGSFDIALVPLRRLDLFKGALPSKIFEAMAAAVPIIVTIDGEARELVEKAQAGIAVNAEDPEALANAILQLDDDPNRMKTLGRNGRRYVMEHYDRQKIAEGFERLLLEGECLGSVLRKNPDLVPHDKIVS